VSYPHRQTRTVPTAKVREWLVWFGEQSTQDPTNTENRRLSNRLNHFCQRAGAPGSTIVASGASAATSSDGLGGLSGFEWTRVEMPFTSRPGFGSKKVERLITRVVAVTGIRE
jgi:hypothetical protein